MVKKIIVALTALLVFSVGQVKASGIPVFDGANAVNMLKQLQAWKQQYDQMMSQINELKSVTGNLEDIKSSTLGSRGLGTISFDIDLQPVYGRSWDQVDSKIESSDAYKVARSDYPQGENQADKELYDHYAKRDAFYYEYYKHSAKRFQQITDLMSQINLAQDPAAKQDLRNRIAIEQANISANIQQIAVMEKKMEREQEVKERAYARSFVCAEMNLGGRKCEK